MGEINYRDPGQVKARLLHRERSKIVRKLQNLYGVERPRNYDTQADPLVAFSGDCPRINNWKFGFHHQPVQIKAFSGILQKPRKYTANLEEAYQEACEIYAGGEDITPCVIFEVNGAWFCYVGVGAVDDYSVLVIHPGHKRTRFIYALESYLSSMGVINKEEE